MPLREQGTGDEVARRRKRMIVAAEEKMEEATGAAIRKFLKRVREDFTPEALSAASPGVSTAELMMMRGWWQDGVSGDVANTVAETWREGYLDTRDGVLSGGARSELDQWLAGTKDRLSRTATPTIPDEAFDKLRVVLAQELAQGRTPGQISRKLAAVFGWDVDSTFWRRELDRLNALVFAELDNYGPRGSAERRRARLHDAELRELIAQGDAAQRELDRTESIWQTRARRIARTETTAALNAGSWKAARDEDAQFKYWVATADDRTRETHLEAHGECRGINMTFEVGGDELMFPGDTNASGEEVINCRCTLVFGDSCVELRNTLEASDRVIEEERERREELEPEPEPEPEPELSAIELANQTPIGWFTGERVDVMTGDTSALGELALAGEKELRDRGFEIHDDIVKDLKEQGVYVDDEEVETRLAEIEREEVTLNKERAQARDGFRQAAREAGLTGRYADLALVKEVEQERERREAAVEGREPEVDALFRTQEPGTIGEQIVEIPELVGTDLISNTVDIGDKIIELRRERVILDTEHQESVARWQEAVADRLHEERGTGYAPSLLDNEVNPNIVDKESRLDETRIVTLAEESFKVYPRDWVEEWEQRANDFKFYGGENRAFFIADSERPYHDNEAELSATIAVRDSADRLAMIHELGHSMEYMNQNIVGAQRAHLMRRHLENPDPIEETSGDTLGYFHRSEFTNLKADHNLGEYYLYRAQTKHWYSSRVYPGGGNTFVNAQGTPMSPTPHLELFTTGMEALQEPEEYNRYMRGDPEFRDFMLGVLFNM